MDLDITLIWGTRPEHIKLFPVLESLKKKDLKIFTINTGQHRDLIDLKTFEVDFDLNFDIMDEGQDLSTTINKVIRNLNDWFSIKEKNTKPKMVVVQGDTSTTIGTAITSFYHTWII